MALMRLLFLAFLALAAINVAAPAAAVTCNGSQVPPDIAALPGWSCATSVVTPVWKTDGTQNVELDPTVTPPPAYSYEMTNIPVPSLTGRETVSTAMPEASFSGYIDNGTPGVAGNILHVTAVASGTIGTDTGQNYYLGDVGTAVAHDTKITGQISGPAGGVGTYQLTNPNVASQLVGSSGSPRTDLRSFAYAFCPVSSDPDLCPQAKFRSFVDFSHVAPDDPIRNYGLPGTSHLHCFFGNGTTNAYSTYASLRRRALTSTASGTDVNGTGYWFPCFINPNPDASGNNYVVLPDQFTLYYVDDFPTSRKRAHLVAGMRYVFGCNMDDGGIPTSADHCTGAWLQSIITATNAAETTYPNRYRTFNNYPVDGPIGYTCIGATVSPSSPAYINSTDTVRSLKATDGSDPYNGTCNGAKIAGSVSGTTLTVTNVYKGKVEAGELLYGDTSTSALNNTFISGQLSSTESGGTLGLRGTYSLTSNLGTVASRDMFSRDQFFAVISGPYCWDGKNLWSPTGYKNVIPPIWDSKFAEWACPINYYRVPALQLEFHFMQYGWADRQNWYLSSDPAARARLGCDETVCPNGFSFHTDWMHGWDQVEMLKWQNGCLGVDGNAPHQCSTSQMNATTALIGAPNIGAGAGGRSPQIDYTPNGSYPVTNMTKIPPAWSGSISGVHIMPHAEMEPFMLAPVQSKKEVAGLEPIRFDLAHVGF